MMDWRTWTASSGGVTWRIATPEDEPALDRLLDQTGKRLGPQDRPPFFAMPCLLCLVAVDVEGAVRDAIYIEAVAEIVKLGLSRESFETVPALESAIRGFLAARRIRLMHVWVPAQIARRMAEVLARVGFSPVRKMKAFAQRT